MIPSRHEPQSANEYDTLSTEAVCRVITEITQMLGSYHGKFVIVGGSVPWLQFPRSDMRHVGTLDVDVALDVAALAEGEYAEFIQTLLSRGYRQDPALQRFKLVRTVSLEPNSPPIDVQIDFLREREIPFVRNKPPLLDNFAVQACAGVDLALQFADVIEFAGQMPGGGINPVEINVCSIPAFLVMKGHALNLRDKKKDAYDLYFCIRNYPGGFAQLAEDCRDIMRFPVAKEAFEHIRAKFASVDHFGPVNVRIFVEDSDALDGRTADEWQQDAYGQVHYWLDALGLFASSTE